MFNNKTKSKINNQNTNAFTLAEVLITLVIIGIVAALTIPAVVTSYQKKLFYTQFMKAYNTLNQVVELSSAYGVDVQNWSFDINNPDNIIDNYLRSQLKVTEEGPIQPYTVKDLDNNSVGALNNYVSGNTGGGTKQYLLADGISIMVSEITSDGAVILSDVNGAKAPNIIGRDIFLFLIRQSVGDVVTKVETGVNNANCGGTPESNLYAGEGCADRLLKEQAMKY